ncbi:GNAT family N-acetyltransferase [Actinacidiphila oryziradicis]|uniref:GNAT family N-acetyltransferase n=1 Tax=Actinacidiphila oryziradicis TaxID=2571141 RepID=UPI0023F595C4|nr:GNAT family N-acetyltransferase [Actinacidiphila oryziradicis]MCW2874279.1 GCN5-related N-acetyltransferase [Actinacidiphila oryziradicis]
MRKDKEAFPPRPASGSAVRPYHPKDEPVVRELINADRLPGQPCCTRDMLADATRGPSHLAGWVAPAQPCISVLADAEDQPHGVIVFLAWPDVPVGLICWLHAREDPAALRALLTHAVAELAGCPLVEAFVGAPPDTLGPGGLSRTRRAATHHALLETGFTGRRQGYYLHRPLPVEGLPAKVVADVFPCEFPPGYRLIIREADEPVAETLVSVGPDHTATVRWIETLCTQRRHGLAQQLLSQALALLAEHGATEVALVVEDLPETVPDSRAAPRLFSSFGFAFIDQLWTYEQRRPNQARTAGSDRASRQH